MSNSAPFTITMQASSTPSWWASVPDLTWTVIPGTDTKTISAYNTTYPTGIGGIGGLAGAWTGGCVDKNRKSLLLPACGGHTGADYHGNEIWELKVTQESCGWQRLNVPSSPTGGTDAYWSEMWWADQKLRSMHSRNIPLWIDGKVWYGWVDGVAGSGYYSSAIWSMDRDALGDPTLGTFVDSRPYTLHGIPHTGFGVGNTAWEGGSCCYDSTTGLIWHVPHGGHANGVALYSFHTSNPLGTFTGHNTGGMPVAGGSSSWSVIATAASPRVLIHGGRHGTMGVSNISTGTAQTWIAATQSDTQGRGLAYQTGAVYLPNQNVVATYNNALWPTSIRKLTIPSDPLAGTYIWTTVPLAGANPQTASGLAEGSNGNWGCHGKFNYIEDMGDGRAAFVLVLTVGGPSFICKIPEAGL